MLTWQVWNEELAAAALAHSRLCTLTPDPNRADQVPSFDTVGEIQTAAGTISPNYTLVIERAWFSQRNNYDFEENMCSSANACSSYTQVN